MKQEIELEAVKAERDALRARIEAAEKQEPYRYLLLDSHFKSEDCVDYFGDPHETQTVIPLYSLPPIPDKQPASKDLIRDVFLRNGFTIKEGCEDLKDYVFNAALELLSVALPPAQQLPMADRNIMRNLVDRVWMHVTESENVPSTKTADELIDRLLSEYSHHCNLKTISDIQVEQVCRAFWRRIEPFKNQYGKELPENLPVEFLAHMATALTFVDKPMPAQQSNSPLLSTWLPALLNHYEKQSNLNKFTPDTSFYIVQKAFNQFKSGE